MTEISDNRPIAIKVSGVKKMYKLGQIGGGTLKADMQSWWAKKRGKEDPNSKIGEGERSHGDTFMALNGIDLTIYQGEAVGIIGRNGAGKSTLLKLLSRVTAPTKGEIDIYGRITSMLEVGTGFNGELTGRENVYMNGAILGMTKAEIDAKMEEIIEFSEVREFIDTPVKRYSSGMFVKLAFSVAAHLNSEIMIMDEVLAVGDMEFQKKCLTKMKEAANQDGRTVLYVSHNMNTIRQLCDRCIVLDKGKIVFEGGVEDGITNYLGGSMGEYPAFVDVSNRPRAWDFGKKAKIESFRFLGKDKAVFEIGEKICVEYIIRGMSNLNYLKLAFKILDTNHYNLGTIISEDFCIKNGETIRVVVEPDLSCITQGTYITNTELIAAIEGNEYISYDNPSLHLEMKFENDFAHGFYWNKQFLGHFALPVMKAKIEKMKK